MSNLKAPFYFMISCDGQLQQLFLCILYLHLIFFALSVIALPPSVGVLLPTLKNTSRSILTGLPSLMFQSSNGLKLVERDFIVDLASLYKVIQNNMLLNLVMDMWLTPVHVLLSGQSSVRVVPEHRRRDSVFSERLSPALLADSL